MGWPIIFDHPTISPQRNLPLTLFFFLNENLPNDKEPDACRKLKLEKRAKNWLKLKIEKNDFKSLLYCQAPGSGQVQVNVHVNVPV